MRVLSTHCLRSSAAMWVLALSASGMLANAAEPTLPQPLIAEAAPAANAVTQSAPVGAAKPQGPAVAAKPAPAAVVPAPIADTTTPSAPPAGGLLPEPGAVPRPTSSLSENVTINLINRLVQRGALTQQDATDLIRLAEQDALMARAQSQALAETQAAVMQQQAATVPPASEDEYRVTYVPETVKDQIRDELRVEVLNQARREHWAAPNAIPEWTQRIKIFGDMRMRQESLLYPSGNDTSGVFPNFNAINTGQPFDTSGTVFSPQLNANQDRERTRLRMRLGFDIDLEDGFTAGIRMATGGNNSPVSTNQTLGSSNGSSQGGGFSKYELWLDRAFIRYEASLMPKANLMIEIGRFQNPFMTSSQIMWDEDVNLDGAAFQITSPWTPEYTTFLTAGAFPVFNSDLNFPSNSPTKGASYNKYLLATQFGVQFKITEKIEAKMSLAYYDWQNIEGRLSSPFVPLNATDAGDTDNSRPLFAQKGNTYRPIRNITPTALNGFGTTNQFQYYGLASKFRQIAWAGRIDFNHYEPMQVSLLGEFIRNNAFERSTINSVAVNNRSGGGSGTFDGGNIAWYMGVNLGKAVTAFDKRGDWAFGLGYRHVESDAVVDAFSESRFGNGGTNMQGYTIQASLAMSKRTWMRAAYMAASQIAGPTLKTDVFLIEYHAKF